MARILFLHNLAGCPGGERVAALRDRGHDVYAPTFPFAESRIVGLLMSHVEQLQRDGRFADLVGPWTKQAQDAFDDFDPELVVGIGIGATIAMRLDSADVSQVLVAPPWSGRVRLHSLLEQIAPLIPATVSGWLRPLLRYVFAALALDPAIKAATVLLHASADEVVNVEDSYRLLRLNPVGAMAERVWIAALARNLVGRGHHPLFRRLVLAGRNHACDCADGLQALADVADAALGVPTAELAMA